MVRNRNGISKNLKDYMVPIIWLVLIIILIFSIFSGDDTNNKKDNINGENQEWLNLVMDSSTTEWYIIYPWENRKKIEWDTTLYKWEKVIVKEWNISLSLQTIWNFKLNKLWEFKYWESWELFLYSSDLWINSKTKLDLVMRYAKITIWKDSSVSFLQNEVWSTVYLMSWFAEVSNLVWKTTVLAPWQKISISRLDASKKELDLSLLKENLWDYFKKTDWFIKNNWNFYLKNNDNNLTLSWTIKRTENNKITSNADLISFSNLIDESQVSASSIVISWTYIDDTIVSIDLNWEKAILNKEKRTFKFSSVSTSNKLNDLVFRVYDDSWDIIERILYTVYYDWGNSNSSSSWNWFKVKTFDVDWSKFIFTSPSIRNSFTTYDDSQVTIKWEVLIKWVISSVKVNDYKLKSYQWSTWRYHASILNNNLKNWTNLYEIKYFDEKWKLVYRNYYTIVKKDPKEKPKKVKVKVEEKTSGIISNEVNIQ